MLEKLKAESHRAVATFCEVFLSVVIGEGLVTDVSVSTLQIAVMSGIGAALSVVYNFVRSWRASLGGQD